MKMKKPTTAPRILVVEDEYFLAQDITNALAALGAMVVGPVRGTDMAVTAIDGGADAAVLDLNLDGSVDFAMADRLMNSKIPFVFATGYDAVVIPSRFAGISRFEKPYDTAKLARHLVDMTREPAAC